MWLYIPSTCCPSAQEWTALDSPSDWQLEMLARSAMSRGKRIASKSWHGACKRASWMSARFGAMLPPSMASLGVAKWIASLQDTRVNRSQSPAREKEPTTADTCGRTLLESLMSASRGSASSRTSQDTFRSVCPKLPMICDGLGTDCQDRSCLLLQPSELRKSVSGCSSLDTTQDWPTPRASSKKSDSGSSQRLKQGANPGLNDMATMWPTPDANEGNGGRRARKGCSQTGQMPDGSKVSVNLQAAVDLWDTPQAHDGRRPGADLSSTQGANLSPASGGTVGESGGLGTEVPYWPPGPASRDEWQRILAIRPDLAPRLNPRFVEWLQGLPAGWCQLEPMNCDAWEIWLCRSRRGCVADSLGETSANSVIENGVSDELQTTQRREAAQRVRYGV